MTIVILEKLQISHHGKKIHILCTKKVRFWNL